MKKKLLALVFCIMLVVSLIPFANAADSAETLTVTGIVIANENYALVTDPAGEEFVDLYPCATGTDSGESLIYYVSKNADGSESYNIITIPVALSDELLGNEVTVTVKANQTSQGWLTNIELVGGVKVTDNTVVYNVPAIDVDAYPNGTSASSAAITPYLAFEVDGEEIKVMAPATIPKIAKNVDFQQMPEISEAFGDISYACDAELWGASGDAGGLYNYPSYDSAFFAEMGTPVLSNYRFVSVDGGETFSYIFKMINDDYSNIKYGAVTGYNEANGTITIEGVRFFLDEVNLIGDIDSESMVVYYYENGTINIEAVEEVTGEVEELNDDGSAKINGVDYYLWANTDLDTASTTLTGYYTENPDVLDADVTYYVYNNIVLDIEFQETISSADDYALILGSSYDEKLDTAYVTLAFTDNTEATYEIGKLNIENRREPYAEENDLASDFAFNSYFGMLVKYEIMDNGKVDLSANDFKKIVGAQCDADGLYNGDEIAYKASHWAHSVEWDTKAYEGVFDIDGSKLYAADENSVLFVIYGNPQHEAKLDGSGAFEDYTINRDGYEPVKAVAYKFVDKRDQYLGTIGSLAANSAINDVTAYSYALNSANSTSRGIVAAAMTIDMDDDTGLAGDTDDLAYIVKSVRKYNVATQDYYLQMTLIGDDGLFTVDTIDGVPGAGETTKRDFSGDLGEIDRWDTSDACEFIKGNFVTFMLNDEGKISMLDRAMDVANSICFNNAVAAEGLYLVNAVSERNGGLFFINADCDYGDKYAVLYAPQSMIKFAKDGYDVITIKDGEYIGDTIYKIPAEAEELCCNSGNAIIQVNDEGEIVRVFSFANSFDIDGYELGMENSPNEIPLPEDTATADDYALILGSSYDATKDTAYVTLVFTDNTQATYEIGKLNVENLSEPYAEENDLASDFAFNSYFGMVVKYEIMDNGKVDLSANDFKKIVGAQCDADGLYNGDEIAYKASHWAHSVEWDTKAYEGVFDIDGYKIFAASEDAVLFVIYGNPQHEAKLDSNGNFEDYTINRNGYHPVKAVAYKFNNKRDQYLGTIESLTANSAISDVTAYSYAFTASNHMNRGIVAAAMTVDMYSDTGIANDTDDIAAIVKAVRKYNVSTRDYYLQMTLINEDGLFTVNTVDGVPGFGDTTKRDLSGDLGEILEDDVSDAAEFAAGFVTYTFNDNGEIATMDKTMDVANRVVFNNAVACEGLYLVNAVTERNGRLFFIEADCEYDGADAIKAAPQSAIKFAEGGYDVISVDYAGTDIVKISSRETYLEADVGNAIIQINDEGEIVRVFSFAEGYYLYSGKITADETVDTPTYVSSVSLNKETLSLEIGSSEKLIAEISPSDATNASVKWTSSDKSVATVDKNGNVTAIGAGSATITATTVDGGYTASCIVTVNETEPEPDPDDPEPEPDPEPTTGVINITTEAKKVAIQGSTFTYTVSFAGTYDGFSFEVLPIDGLEITEIVSSNDNINVDEIGDHWMVSVLGGLEKVDSEKEEILSVTVKVSSDAEVGPRELSLSNILISDEYGDQITDIGYDYATIQVTDQLPGDINADGIFNYFDVSKLYAFYRGKATVGDFIEMDINNDGTFDYLDVVKLYAIYRQKATFE